MNKVDEYYSKIEFESISDVPTAQNLIDLEEKKGIAIDTGTTSLWLSRKIDIIKFMNIPTAMEIIHEFMIRDNFGMVMYVGSPEEIVEFVTGFIEED